MIESKWMNWRNKWAFWATVAAVLALVSVPSIEWVSALNDYRRFLAGWQGAPLKLQVFDPRDERLALKTSQAGRVLERAGITEVGQLVAKTA